jgi:metal-responsive CopG/Arc/MetJ family transcriptional regulator
MKRNDSGSKVMSLRLPADLAQELAAVARTDEVSIAESIRAAISAYITARRSNPGFQARREELMKREIEILEGLGDTDDERSEVPA